MRALARRYWGGLVGGTLVAMGSPGGEAHACSLAFPDPLIRSMPESDETEVPLNVSPVIVGALSKVEVSTAEGEPVDAEVVFFSQGATLRFFDSLLPETGYHISIDGGAASLDFTTGSSEAEEAEVPAPSGVVVSGVVAEVSEYWLYQCFSPTEFACVAADVPENYAVVFDVSTSVDDVDRHVLTPDLHGGYGFSYDFSEYSESGASWTGFLTPGWDPESCVSVRLRSVSGHEGPAVELCPDDISIATPAVLTAIDCDGGTIIYTEGQGSDPAPGPAVPEPEPQAGEAGSGGGSDPVEVPVTPLPGAGGAQSPPAPKPDDEPSEDDDTTPDEHSPAGSEGAPAEASEDPAPDVEPEARGTSRDDPSNDDAGVPKPGAPEPEPAERTSDKGSKTLRGVDAESSSKDGCSLHPGERPWQGAAWLVASLLLCAGARARRRG